MAAALQRVLGDATLAETLRAEGRRVVELHHDRDAEMDRLSRLYASLAS